MKRGLALSGSPANHARGRARDFGIAIGAIALFGTLTGCTTVKISGGSTKLVAGALSIKPDADVALVAIESTGLGLVPGTSGLTLGYQSESVVLLPKDSPCAVVVFTSKLSEQERAFWSQIIRQSSSVCLTGGQFNAKGEDR